MIILFLVLSCLFWFFYLKKEKSSSAVKCDKISFSNASTLESGEFANSIYGTKTPNGEKKTAHPWAQNYEIPNFISTSALPVGGNASDTSDTLLTQEAPFYDYAQEADYCSIPGGKLVQSSFTVIDNYEIPNAQEADYFTVIDNYEIPNAQEADYYSIPGGKLVQSSFTVIDNYEDNYEIPNFISDAPLVKTSKQDFYFLPAAGQLIQSSFTTVDTYETPPYITLYAQGAHSDSVVYEIPYTDSVVVPAAAGLLYQGEFDLDNYENPVQELDSYSAFGPPAAAGQRHWPSFTDSDF